MIGKDKEAIPMIQLDATTLDLVATAPPSDLFDRLTRDLRPAVKRLARQIAASETNLAVLAFLRCYPYTALTAHDLARQIDRPYLEAAPALAGWVAAGLVEDATAGDITFYRLTTDAARLRDLEDVLAWQARWLDQALGIAQAIGVPMLPLRSPVAAVLPETAVAHCQLGHALNDEYAPCTYAGHGAGGTGDA
jgi:hypothetical protein